MRSASLVVAALACSALPAPAYYHFIHYINGVSAPEKFDLSVLPGKTVNIFVSENGPQTYSQTDTFNSVLAQIRQAVAVWNGVSSSDLRVAFGGLENGATPQNTPGGDVVFEDLPPGIYGYGGPTSKAVPTTAADGSTFIPILRSTVHLNRNLTVLPGPSYQETFFMTVVHELGHALGLQHTFTSATMSQATTRSTNLSRPIDNDDIAGLSVLYPNPNFAQFGSVTGRVTVGAQGVHLASVVAIRPGIGAVSAVTGPDGSFRIDGIPPGPYFLYAHTMPPDANIQGPWNSDGSVAAASGPINTLFYPGTSNPALAAAVSVVAGQVTAAANGGAINIGTSARSALTLYDDVIYSYFNNYTIAVQPGFVDILSGNTTVVASGYGLGSNGQSPGLGVQFIGNSVTIQPGGIRPYLAYGYTYVALDLAFPLGGQLGPQHIVYSTPTELYVLPSAFSLTQTLPPTVASATANPDGSATITGTNWAADTKLYFDGLPTTIKSLDTVNGVAVVQPPPGAVAQQSIVTAYNRDGQNSQILQSAAPVTFAYGAAPTPSIAAISPATLPAGAEAIVDITGAGFNFVAGQTAVGFGTSDILVRRLYVLDSTHLRVDVSIAAGAALATSDVSVFSGFQMATAPSAFQITAAVPGLPAPIPALSNALPGLNGVYNGAIVSLYGSNLSNGVVNPVVLVGGQPAAVLYASATQLNLQLPTGLAFAPTTLTVNNGVQISFPVEITIDPTPAAFAAIQLADGTYVDANHAIRQGDTVIVTLSNFATTGSAIDPSRVQVLVGKVLHPVYQVAAVGSVFQVSFLMNASDPVGQSEELVVYLDGRSSYPAYVPVAHTDGTFTQ